jgi:hypothetical protein
VKSTNLRSISAQQFYEITTIGQMTQVAHDMFQAGICCLKIRDASLISDVKLYGEELL